MLLLLLILLLLLHFTWINNFFRYLPTYIILSGSHFLRIYTKSKECVWECAKRKREKNEIRWVVFALVWAKSTQLFCCFVDVVLLGNRRRKEREIWRSSLRSIEQLVVVISYKNHFYSVATHQRKIFWYILRRRHKMRSFSFSLVSIAFNSTRARAFYFLCFYHVLLQQLCLYFLRNIYISKSREEKKEVWLSWGSDLEIVTYYKTR